MPAQRIMTDEEAINLIVNNAVWRPDKMNEKTATAIAEKSLPCPFCGERLVSKRDHHGYWVAHEQEPGPCFDSTIQLMDADDLKRWNTRDREGP